jgi:hypothetical protein
MIALAMHPARQPHARADVLRPQLATGMGAIRMPDGPLSRSPPPKATEAGRLSSGPAARLP